MKITTISDTHRKHSQVDLEGGDLLIHAGDIGAHNKETLVNFLGWFQKQPYKHKIFIAGNHDGFIQNHPGQSKYVIDKYGVHYLEDEYVTINDIKIYGTPWCKEFGGWSFMMDDTPEKLGVIYDIIPEVDILVSHGPPYGILDVESKRNEKCGSICLYKRIKEIKPDTVIFGHIHECGGKQTIEDNIHFMNSSVVNRSLEVVNKPFNYEYIKK